MVSKKLFWLHELVDFTLLTGTLLGVCGTYWDIQYHIDFGRDSFWINPHLMVYGGVVLVFAGSLLGLWNVRKIADKKLRRRLSWAVGVIFVAVISQILAAPIDDLWHRIFGLDITVWSPPHVLLLLTGFLIALSFIYFQRLYLHVTRLDRVGRFTSDEFKLELMFAIALVGLSIFVAEYEYFRTIPGYHISHQRPNFLYLSILAVQFSFMLTLAKVLVNNKGVATRIAALYFIIRFALSLILFSGDSWPIFPPLVIPAAMFYDYFLSKKKPEKLKRFLRATAVFVFVFYLVLNIYLPQLGIGRFAEMDIAVLVFTLAFSLCAALVAYKAGRRILKHVNS